MSSDYEPHGSVSNNQVMPQRKSKDTYFGELVLKNTKTGENTAQNIRDEIFQLNTARLRRFYKKGIKYGYNTKYIFQSPIDLAGYSSKISQITGNQNVQIQYQQLDNLSTRQSIRADYSSNRDYYLENGIDPNNGNPYIGSIIHNGTKKYINNVSSNGFQNDVFNYTDGTIEATSIPPYSTPAGIPGFYAEYTSNGRTYFFKSNDAYFRQQPSSTSIDVETFPIISFQDNNNNELPYEATIPPDVNYSIPKDSPSQPNFEFIKRHEVMRAFGLDFESMSRQVFSYIPPLGSQEWNETYGSKFSNSPKLISKYGTEAKYRADIAKEVDIPALGTREWRQYVRSWKANIKNCCKNRNSNGECTGSFDNNPRPEQKKFCEDNPTIEIYRNKLIEDKEKAAENIANITDAYFGLFVSAKKLDEDNCTALLFTLEPILEHMKKGDVVNSSGGFQVRGIGFEVKPSYSMNIKSSSFDVEYGFSDWSYCMRYGVADPILYPEGLKTPKYRHGASKILDDSYYGWNDGEYYTERDESFQKTRAPDFATSGGQEPTNMLELRVQDRNSSNGRPRFLELRLYDPVAKHKVDVIRDGEFGKAGNVVVAGGLTGFYDDDPEQPYSDVLIFPISVSSVDEVRMFRRERLIRECTITYIAAIKMEEVKWYQQGWFRIVMVIGSLVLAYFTGGISLVIQTGATLAVLYIVSSLIDNPILKAVIQLVILIYTGYMDTNSFFQNAVLLVEASGIVLQGVLSQKLLELQDEMKAFRKMVNSKEEEMEKMREEVGMETYNEDWILYISSLAPTEDASDFYDRALNNEMNKIENGDIGTTEPILPAPKS